jgi:hypothetical protein
LEIDNNVEEEEEKELEQHFIPFSWVYVRMRMLSLRPELVLAEECQPKCIYIYIKRRRGCGGLEKYKELRERKKGNNIILF